MKEYRLSQIKTDIDVPKERLPEEAARILGIDAEDFNEFEIRRKSVDSRQKPRIFFVYTVQFKLTADKERYLAKRKIKNLSIASEEEAIKTAGVLGPAAPDPRPVVVGTGPAGLFAALELAKAGAHPLIIERGPSMTERAKACEIFMKDKILDPEANMLFGEGGAGTFSDGKLASGIKDSHIRQVLSEFKDAGAGDEVMYLARPHIGTDVLRDVIVNIRKKIEMLGGEFRFNTRLESVIIEEGKLKGIKLTNEEQVVKCDAMVLAIGHSARDTFAMIKDAGLEMEQKAFSIGVRMEHSQDLINAAQYGEENIGYCTDAVSAEREPGRLPPADYKLSYKASNGRGVYSFCMCPGGEVVVCSTNDGELCVNGMSERARASGRANSGILCDVKPEDFGSRDVLAGVRFQEKYERLAFQNGGENFTPPSCNMDEFLNEDAASAAVYESLPDFASEAIREAVPEFARIIKGYDDPEAIVTAVETRSSSPVRILRDAKGESNIKGIYPAGEGAGYAGGITSAACDGIRSALLLLGRYE